MRYDVSDYHLMDDFEILRLPAAQGFCGDDALLLCDEHLSGHNWKERQTVIARAFHGTTHLYDQFDTKRCSHDGYFGQCIYLTSSHFDAHANYGHAEGPDLKNNIQLKAERLVDNISDDPETFGLEDPDEDDIEDRAKEIARRLLVGSTERVIELLVRLERPFVIDASKHQSFPIFDYAEVDALRSDAAERVLGEHGLSIDDRNDLTDEIEDEVMEAEWDAISGLEDKLVKAYRDAVESLAAMGTPIPDFPNLGDLIEDITTAELHKKMSEMCELFDLSDEEGNTVYGSIFSRMVRNLGFDSIVLINADKQFANMSMDYGTTHIHLLDNRPEQILQLNRDVQPILEDVAA